MPTESANVATRVLLVEDNRAEAVLLQEALLTVSPGEFVLTRAETLRVALDTLAAETFDAILLDLSLPDSRGLQTVDRIAAASGAAPLLVLTGLADEDMAMQAVQKGAQDYLVKGETDSRSIARQIRYAIYRKGAEEALRQARDQLEERVRERTADLRAVVDQLQGEVRQRLLAETELSDAVVILRMVGEVNEALVRADNEDDLIKDICRIAVQIGGYRMAWVGFAQSDDRKTVRPVAAVGFEQGYLDRAQVTWSDDERGRGPTGTAIRTGKPQMGRNFLTAPELAPWREAALRSGFQSSLALPLANGGHVFGALTIYSAHADAFNESRVATLQEMADNLAFGILALRTRKALVERSAQLRAMASQLTLAEERERQRMARVLHDHLQQLLVAARFWIGGLEKSRAKGVQDAAREIGSLVDQALQSSRTLTGELSPPALQEGGLADGLDWLAQWMRSKHGLAVEFQTDGDGARLPEDVTILLFQCVRELLLNIVKHARVKAASVRMDIFDGQVCLVVRDEGAGFDPAKVSPGGGSAGFGLLAIRERVEVLGGCMDIDSAPGRGSRFMLTVPLRCPACRDDAAETAATREGIRAGGEGPRP